MPTERSRRGTSTRWPTATSKLDEAAKAEFVAHEAELLEEARRSSVEQFEQRCRDRARTITADDGASELERQRRANRIKHWIDDITGMGHIHTELDPESHAKVLAAIYARLRVVRRGQRSSTRQRDADPAAHRR